MVPLYAFAVWSVSAELFGVKLGQAHPLGSTLVPINVQSPFLKLTQSLWNGNSDCLEDDIYKTSFCVMFHFSTLLKAFLMDSLTLVPGLTTM